MDRMTLLDRYDEEELYGLITLVKSVETAHSIFNYVLLPTYSDASFSPFGTNRAVILAKDPDINALTTDNSITISINSNLLLQPPNHIWFLLNTNSYEPDLSSIVTTLINQRIIQALEGRAIHSEFDIDYPYYQLNENTITWRLIYG